MKNIIILILISFCCTTLYADEKPIISVLDFFTEEGISISEMRLFISLLSSALFQTKIYTVIDVSERESLLKEMEFSVSGCSDESCQLEIGRLLAAEAIIIGRIGSLGTRYVLSIKMLETDTGRAINTADGIYDTIDAMVDDVGVIAKSLSSAHLDREDVVPVEDEKIAETDESAVTGEIEETKDTEEMIEDAATGEEAVIDDIQPEPTPVPGKKGGFSYSIGMEGGVKFIVSHLGEIFDFGLTPIVSFDLELHLGRSKLGFGLLSGVNFDQTKKSVPMPYHMITIPAGANLHYTTGFMLPFFLLVEVWGGMTFSFVQYAEDVDMDDLLVIKPFAGAKAGAGFVFTKNVRFVLGAGYMVIFFDKDPFLGVFPLARVEIHF